MIGKNSNKKNQEEITCQSHKNDESKILNVKECSDGSFQEIVLDSSLYKITSSPDQVQIQNLCDNDEDPIILSQEDSNFCV